MTLLERLDRWRHLIPFWWWLTYDALVAVVILLGFLGYRDAILWVGFAVLAVAVAIDTVEFIVKRPSARAKLLAYPDPSDAAARLDRHGEDSAAEGERQVG